MSDKSFGDHLNRNIVKNPLLSSAVTGLSIEDLTHNAVLLPVAPSQELITRQDQNSGPQSATLAQRDSKYESFISGDANSNILHANCPPTNKANYYENQENIKDILNQQLSQSKASTKCDDDFDVNEYYARLQGTRYVSAPLNSLLKDDRKATLEATEENLEEINLNEPEKAQHVEAQQSLTADIAQNFSQLPTVLPQVASAVFSSFSNMLSMKSREQTPDEPRNKPPSYQEVQFQRSEEFNVPLKTLDEPIATKEVAPPPTQPPVGGTNYRITTKKKAYAQIPGLSSTHQVLNPPNTTPYYHTDHSNLIPYQQVNISGVQSNETRIPAAEIPQAQGFNIFNPGPAEDNTQPNLGIINTELNTFNPLAGNKSFAVNASNIQKEANIFKPVDTQEHVTNLNIITNTSIIPPPPMFSNAPKKDGQSNLKSVLPPSVARRIGSNHPIMKPETLLTVLPTDNIFVPAPGSDIATENFGVSGMPLPILEDKSAMGSQSAFVQFNTPTANIESSSTSLLTDTTAKPPPVMTTPVNATMNLTSSQPTQFIPQSDRKPPINIPSITSQAGVSSTLYTTAYASQDTLPPPMMYDPNAIPSIPFFKSPEIAAGTTQILPIEKHPPINQPPMPSNFNEVQQSTGPNVAMQSINSSSVQHVDQNMMIEAPKTLPEPPKLTGNMSYRMTKKRPQYYSGPIEGVGAISNNVNPTISAVEPYSGFQGAVLTPDVQPTIEQPVSVISAFDINQHSVAQPVAPYTPLEINKTKVLPPTQNYAPSEYNTAFDLSRPTADNFESPKPESKGFGIIGSLKSKLSSLDINKIQNSVTTFFDPTYNDKKETNTEGSIGYNAFNYQDGSLEVFVPNVEQSNETGSQTYGQYNYQNPYNYGQDSYQMPSSDYGMHAYDSQSYFTNNNYNPNPQTQSSDASSFQAPYSTSYFNTQLPVTQTYNDTYNYIKTEQAETNIPSHTLPTQIVESFPCAIVQKPAAQPSKKEGKCMDDKLFQAEQGPSQPIQTLKQGTSHKSETNTISHISSKLEDTSAISFFDNQQIFNLSQPVYSDELNKKLENLQIKQEIQKEPSADSNALCEKNKADCFSNDSEILTPIDLQIASKLGGDFLNEQHPLDYLVSKGKENLNKFDTNDSIIGQCRLKSTSNDGIMDDIPRLDAPTILFGLPSIPPTHHISDIDNNIESVPLYEPTPADIPADDDDFFDNIIDENKPLSKKCESHSELNICETCREFHTHEGKEVDDLTTQLIENITSPIQLSNPVVAELTESNSPNEERTDFDSQQCDEITHITEETIETIQVQSAAELLDDVDELNNINVRNYGWVAEEPAYPQASAVVDHDYSFQIDPNAIGFYGNNAMFFENMPTNASDEIKAEYQSSQDEPPVVLQNQISIPSAPPAEDDDDGKSDETGILDVHSIEQDAKKDFPIFEEFVIEPSETDDDKIEYKERERSSDDPAQDTDTFTNRVERFKNMEELIDKSYELFDSQKNLFDLNEANPAVSMASYFDTGNYAADTHYRNSMTSPSISFEASSMNIPFSIPPGFEDEYKRRLSAMTVHDDIKSDKDENVPYIPDTSTQTRPVVTTTYSSISSISPHVTAASTIKFSKLEEAKKETQKLPDFSTVFGHKPESGDNLASSLFAKIEDKPTAIIHEPKVIKEPAKPLEDPMSFFSDKNDTSKDETTDGSFNRLASYFAAPAKIESSKSFFELSQSQNHYRHANTTISFDSGVRNINKACQNNPAQTSTLHNIPPDVYLANLSLINDLTSSQNIAFKPNDQIVRTINYFTVQYENDIEIKQNIEDHIKSVGKRILNEPRIVGEIDSDDANYVTVVSKCKFCCNNKFHSVIVNKVNIKSDFIVRKVNDSGKDSNSENKPNRTTDMDQRAQDGNREVAVNFENPIEEDSERAAIMSENRLSSSEYSPVIHHWFYRVDFEGKSIWRGFSITDNKALEEAFLNPDLDENTVVATDGGRFDVNIIGRLRTPVYWSDKPTNVRRCSWFYKGTTDARYVPYTESVAEKLEEEYRHAITTGEWHRRLVLPSRELVVLHGPAVMVHLAHPPDALTAQPLFSFGKRVYRNPPKMRVARDQPQVIDHLLLLVHGAGEYRSQKEKEKFQSTMRPRVVRRGCDETEIEDCEPSSIDHLLLLCHGVGSACDMRFRSVEEVVEDFRATSLQLVQSHYKNSCDQGVVNRVEVLPISWHATLHSGETGVDKRLSAITLDSIPRLRNFTNDTVLDVLFYTSPVFCQTIIDTVCAELNRIYRMFTARNPSFSGRVSLGGHSLGSVILYDLLCHQHPDDAPDQKFPSKKYVQGAAGTGQASVKYPALDFNPAALYALGSPIAMFECIRGVKSLGADFCLPTCKNFFNIFHPYDPIAYRIEPLINDQLGSCKPFLIPHHKGRKRMHLELKDTMARVGADLKQKLIESLKSTWSSMWKTQPPPNDGQLEKVVEEEMEKEQLCEEIKEDVPPNNDFATPEAMGVLNAGRRVDYVLQEAPFEMINEYLFAMSSHVCYWESEDTMLLILKEIYESLGVRPDCTVPQQSMTVQRTRNTNEFANLTTSDIPSTSRDST